MILEFDPINILGAKADNLSKTITKRRSVPYKEYFGEMILTPRETQQRISLAEEIEMMMIYLFAYIAAMGESAALYRQNIINTFQERYAGIIGHYVVPDDYTEMYSRTIAPEITDVTLRHIGAVRQDESSANLLTLGVVGEMSGTEDSVTDTEKEYYLSDDRAMFIAEGEANSILNYGDLKTAIFEGCKWKQWQTKEDRRVRQSHAAVNGETIGIQDLFKIGDSYMAFPRDISHGASVQEIAGCRCSLKYLK